MTADKMREDFEAWYCANFLQHAPQFIHNSYFELVDGEYVSLHCHGAYAGYKLATEQSTAKLAQMQTELEAYRTMQRTDNSAVIAQMQARIDELVDALQDAEESLGRFKSDECSTQKDFNTCDHVHNALAKVKDVK